MNTKIWIGNDAKKRRLVLSMIDIDKFGGKRYFRGCTSIFFYRKDTSMDVRVMNKENDRIRFNSHPNKEIKLLP